MKVTIEIEDTLKETVDQAIEEVKDLLIDHLNADFNKEADIASDIDICLNNDLDYSGKVSEIIDGAVPIYTNEIEGLWYIYKDEFEEAYGHAGFGDNPLENNGMTAIYCYIQEAVNEWYYANSEDVIADWIDTNN